MNASKLLRHYQKKVDELDDLIKKTSKLITEARSKNSSDLDELSRERIINHIKRQIYFQFTKDLEDLI
ncbi:MAG: hypothetical protein HRU40_21590 [Saprospiraceae bacterium]|nr:hypothetical protein [Saprospiraceae bacterium]